MHNQDLQTQDKKIPQLEETIEKIKFLASEEGVRKLLEDDKSDLNDMVNFLTDVLVNAHISVKKEKNEQRHAALKEGMKFFSTAYRGAPAKFYEQCAEKIIAFEQKYNIPEGTRYTLAHIPQKGQEIQTLAKRQKIKLVVQFPNKTSYAQFTKNPEYFAGMRSSEYAKECAGAMAKNSGRAWPDYRQNKQKNTIQFRGEITKSILGEDIKPINVTNRAVEVRELLQFRLEFLRESKKILSVAFTVTKRICCTPNVFFHTIAFIHTKLSEIINAISKSCDKAPQKECEQFECQHPSQEMTNIATGNSTEVLGNSKNTTVINTAGMFSNPNFEHLKPENSETENQENRTFNNSHTEHTL